MVQITLKVVIEQKRIKIELKPRLNELGGWQKSALIRRKKTFCRKLRMPGWEINVKHTLARKKLEINLLR